MGRCVPGTAHVVSLVGCSLRALDLSDIVVPRAVPMPCSLRPVCDSPAVPISAAMPCTWVPRCVPEPPPSPLGAPPSPLGAPPAVSHGHSRVFLLLAEPGQPSR